MSSSVPDTSDSHIERAITRCYAHDGDEGRKGTRYYSLPEDYVRLTLAEIASALRADEGPGWIRPNEKAAIANWIEGSG